ncbi:MAG: sigma-70 family RNA polymerase sigma factor [Sedimentisphaerales bacterium]
MTDGEKDIIFSETNGTEIRKRVGLAAEVIDRYGDEIRAIIHFNVKDKSKADDIFQEFFVSIVHKPIPSGIQDIRAYLYRAVTNDVIDVSRQIKCHQDHIQKYAECRKHFVISEDPQNTAIHTENAKKMFHLIESRLPKREAEVVVQRYGQGLSTTDTAENMSVNKRIVSRYLSIALKKMREFVPKNEDDTI